MTHTKLSLAAQKKHQRGATLIELLVGITIGLLTVVVGLGAVVVSRSLSGTVSDASRLQQQASYAFRVIGQQLRQTAGLAIDPTTGTKANVEFSVFTSAPTSPISGKESPASSEFKLALAYQSSLEPIYASPTATAASNGYLLRNCLAENPDSSNAIVAPVLESKFKLDAKNNLVCAGSGAAQPIVSGVMDFQVTYLQQVLDAATKQPQFRYTTATNITTSADWGNVHAVEVCLEFEGDEIIDTAGSTYRDCNWKTGDAEKPRGKKMRVIYRNTFYVRNQGWQAT